MKKSVTKSTAGLLTLLFCYLNAFAQVGIGTTNPDESSVLEIFSADKGILIPRIALSGTNDTNTVANPVTSLLVYNTNNTTGSTQVEEGFYYWDGSKWVGLMKMDANSVGVGWLTSGNSGTDPSNNFVGTLDNQVLMFRTNNTERIEISHKSQIEYFNNGNSVFLGHDAGENDNLSDNQNVYIGKSSLGTPNSEGNVLVGYDTNTNSNYAVALGYKAKPIQNNSIAIGKEAVADANNTLSIGWLAKSSKSDAIALGRSTNADEDAAIAIGEVAYAGGVNSISIGRNAISTKTGGVAIGLNGYADDGYGVSIGTNSRAISQSTTAVGHNAVADNFGAAAYGLNAHANNNNALSMGRSSKAESENAIAIGTNSTVNSNGSNGIALGTGARADGNNAAAYGSGVLAYNNQVRLGGYYITSIGGPTNWTNLSDARFKYNIKENVPGLSFIKKLKPVTYQLDVAAYTDYMNMPDYLKDESSRITKQNEIQTGFLAQDVEKAAKSLNFDFSGVDRPDNSHDPYGLRYAAFVVPLVKSVQELSLKIDELNDKLEKLAKENKQLKNRLEKLVTP